VCDAYQQPQLVRKQELWERSVKLLLFLFQGLELSFCLVSAHTCLYNSEV